MSGTEKSDTVPEVHFNTRPRYSNQVGSETQRYTAPFVASRGKKDVGFHSVVESYGILFTVRCVWVIDIHLLNAVQPNLRHLRNLALLSHLKSLFLFFEHLLLTLDAFWD